MDSRAPERFAAIVAPAVDRVHAGVHQRSRARGADLARRHGVQHPGLLITLRFVLLRGALARAAFPLAVRYEPVESVLHAVDDLVATGWLGPVHDADAPRTDSAGTVAARTTTAGTDPTGIGAGGADSAGCLAAGEPAVAFLSEVYDLHAAVTEAAWPTDLSALVGTAGALLAAGAETGGLAFAAFSPPHERPGDPDGVLLFNRLAALRYHRSDAHAAAWSARGLGPAEVAALPAGVPLRQDIEADTNRRAAPPFAALTPEQRLAFLAGLAALA